MTDNDKKKGLISQSIIYLVANLLNAAIPFALLPVLTRVLAPSEYGQIAIFQTSIAALGAFIGLSVQGATLRKFYDQGQTEDLAAFIGTCVQILLITALIASGVIFVFSDTLQGYTGITLSWLLFVVTICLSDFLVQIRLTQWQVRGKAVHFGVLQVARTILNLLLTLLFVLVMLKGADGRVMAITLTALLFGLIAVLSLRSDNLIKFLKLRPDYYKEALSFGIPLIPHVSGAFLISSADRFLINSALGMNSAGLYMVAAQLAMGAAMVFDSFNRAYAPWLYGKLSTPEPAGHAKIVRFTYIYFALLLLLIPLAFLVGPYVLIFIAGERYAAAAEVIGLLVTGQIFGGMYLMVTNYVFYSKRVGYLSLITISSGLLNLLLLSLLLPKIGLTGAALAFAISMFIQFILTWFLAAKRHPMPWLKIIVPV